MSSSKLTLLVLLAFASGCAPAYVQYTPLAYPPKPVQPREANSVQMFTAGPPARKFVELGTMRATSSNSTYTMFRVMREDAGGRGCDALVVTQQNPQSTVATCIVYTD